ncbi:MAG TPA: hypothetical protein VHP35_13375 [Terriglobia bacterium]|nr:hypothetical protein [Terriglobia bacterium]
MNLSFQMIVDVNDGTMLPEASRTVPLTAAVELWAVLAVEKTSKRKLKTSMQLVEILAHHP